MKSVSMGSFQYKKQVNGEFVAYLWVILLYFSLESRLIPAVLVKSGCFENWLGQEFDSCYMLSQTGVWKYFPSSWALK